MTTQASVFDAMTNDDRWLGFGYLGDRRHALDSTDPGAPARPERVAAADKLALELAAGMTAEALFAWANSKDGRWFAELAIGDGDLERARRYGPKGSTR